jgi:iron complex outermembrane receptor protein
MAPGRFPRFALRCLISGAAVFSLPLLANNNPTSGSLDALKQMSVEELMGVEITSVSRREEPLRDAAAAIAVLTQEKLRRSGAETVPDALRMVPGIHVGQQTASSWAVGARGFSSVTSEKLLVLSDTRSVYTPLFSGVLWDVQDYLFEDIDRIEVIRGPGAALWGSNAVNGIVNITTRSARDTHGTYLEAGAGTFDRARVAARYGGETAGGVHYRIFGKYLDRRETQHVAPDTDDEWRLGHVGFRTDWSGADRDSFTVQGDAYSGDVGKLLPAATVIGRDNPQGELDTRVSGGNVLARWRRSSSESSDLQVRAYYDYTRRDDPSFLDTLHTFDIDIQQRFAASERHEILWGASYRLTSNRNRSGGVFAVDPEKSDDQLLSGFIQDQMTLAESVQLTIGTKLEENDFSGFEVQPSIRLAWSPRADQTVWSAVSRAARVPTRLERDIAIEVTPPGNNPVVGLLGNDDFKAERLTAYEVGYRFQPVTNLSFDLALFYNDYERLASLEFGTFFVGPDGRLVVPIVNENLTSGRTRGAELQLEWSPADYWHVTAVYTHLDMSLTPSGADNNRGEWFEGSTPRGIVGLRSWLTLGERFEVDAHFRHQSRIRQMPVAFMGEGVDAYSELDLRLGWRASAHWELSLVGQNLLHDQHAEFGPSASRGEIERGAYLKATWRN